MKKSLLFLSALVVSTGLWAQPDFMDDFESYTAGEPLGPQSAVWTTWSNADGGAEDADVVDDNAASGSQSVYFLAANSQGGPSDVILPIGDNLNTGSLNFSMNMFVAANKGGYFNFQKEPTPGITWALEIHLLHDGSLLLVDDGNVVLSTTYPNGEWFNIEFDINFNTNAWELLIDGESRGVISNGENEISSVDIFPVNPSTAGGNGQAEFWIDDVSFTIEEYVLPPLNGAVVGIDPISGLVGQARTPRVGIRNLGINDITSVELSVMYGDAGWTESFSDLSLSSLEVIYLDLNNPIVLEEGATTLTVAITSVNGQGLDDDPADDAFSLAIEAILPAEGKMVLGEEGTGTWCQWCPRGAVAMDHMAEFYTGYWAGIAVHNGDPMAIPMYDDHFAPAIGSAYPGGLVDREVSIDPSGFEGVFTERITLEPSVWLQNGAEYNEIDGTLQVSVTSTFQEDLSGNWKIACVITENNVTGTGSGYAQANAYAGGANGEMGGYENLPSTVPASMMEYHDVARAISPSYGGQANAYPSASTGEEFVHNFTFQIPMEDGELQWNPDELNIVAFVIDPSGTVDNASHSTLQAAEENGFVAGEIVTGTFHPEAPDASIKLFPNPTSGNGVLTLDIRDRSDVKVRLLDARGRTVAGREYGRLQGAHTIVLPSGHLSQGVYLVHIQIGDELHTRKLMVE